MDPGPGPGPDPGLTIVLLGNTGVGKSASGNTILGRPAFESKRSFRPVTRQISEATETVFGKQISVIDTPDIFGSEEQIKTWCQDLLQSSRPLLFLVVLRVERFTPEKAKVLEAAGRVLGPQEFGKCYLLFTGGDALEDRSLEDFVFGNEPSSSHHTTFLGKCHLFNNINGDRDQVRELLIKTGHLRIQRRADSPADDRRIVLLGLSGGGKSSSGNTILGSHQFQSAGGFNLISTESVSRSARVEGRQVTVVDTPGFTDEVLTPEQLFREIMKSIVEASPGPHAFIIVVRIGSMSTTDDTLFEMLPQVFDSDALKYSMVLFTHGDELKGKSINDLIQSNRHVSDLVSLCGGRFCVFDNNRTRSREQVRNLLNQVDDMVSDNGGQHYTDDMFRMVETLYREQRNLAGEKHQISSIVWKKMWPFIKRHKLICFLVCLTSITGAAVAVKAGAGGAAGAGIGAAAAAGIGAEIGARMAVAVGVKVGIGAGIGAAAGAGIGARIAVAVGVKAGIGAGIGAEAGAGVKAGVKAGIGAGQALK